VIPLHRHQATGRELEYVARAIGMGKVAGDGFFTRACARLLEERLGVERVLMTPSCTSALEMAVLLCDLGPGAEVILPSFTFVSTANAVVRAGARPVFVEIRRDTLNLDESLIEAGITPRTRAIMPVHYAGVACAMDKVLAVAARHGLMVIEDAAQAVNAFFNGRALGSLGHLGAFSFHDTKNFACGEGGALCVNDPRLRARAEVVREKGTNRSQFVRGEVDRYTWVDVGSSYIPSELACAYLCAQLESMEELTECRRALDCTYRNLLGPLARQGLLTLPHVPAGCTSNYHNFFVLVPSRAERDGLAAHLGSQGISASFHFIPLHSSPMGQQLGYCAGDLPITEDLSQRLLRLPFYPGLAEEEQERVVHHVGAYLRRGVEAFVSADFPLASLAVEDPAR
jgi:dTDP-4-amino-4,6-dideoxygalactose transaminase